MQLYTDPLDIAEDEDEEDPEEDGDDSSSNEDHYLYIRAVVRTWSKKKNCNIAFEVVSCHPCPHIVQNILLTSKTLSFPVPDSTKHVRACVQTCGLSVSEMTVSFTDHYRRFTSITVLDNMHCKI